MKIGKGLAITGAITGTIAIIVMIGEFREDFMNPSAPKVSTGDKLFAVGAGIAATGAAVIFIGIGKKRKAIKFYNNRALQHNMKFQTYVKPSLNKLAIGIKF